MRMIQPRFAILVSALTSATLLCVTGDVRATLAMQKKAKELGYPAQNCLYCHGEKLPKKGAVTQNARGQWLVGEKVKRKAKELDVSWLKDYDEKAEKK